MDHLPQNNLLQLSQHGFKARKPCMIYLLDFLEILTSTMDNEEALDMILLDFAKAFNKVPHKRLLAQLESWSERPSP